MLVQFLDPDPKAQAPSTSCLEEHFPSGSPKPPCSKSDNTETARLEMPFVSALQDHPS